MRINMAGLDAETKKSLEASIKEMRAQIEVMEKNPEQKELMRQMAEMTRAEDKKRYEEQLKVWEEKVPVDPRILIKKRMGDFLATSADVDFSAKLVSRDDKMLFVKEEYELKPSEWKICFRAGKEATDTAAPLPRPGLRNLRKTEFSQRQIYDREILFSKEMLKKEAQFSSTLLYGTAQEKIAPPGLAAGHGQKT